MRPILESLAMRIAELHSSHLEKVRVILPNRRAGVFLRKHLAKHLSKTCWSPLISSISEYISEISVLEQSDTVETLFLLYDLYREVVPESESFDEFFHWGEIMLRDFDEIDKYMVDADQLFTNVIDLKQLEEPLAGLDERQLNFIRQFWEGFYKGDRTREKAEFLETWKRLPLLYRRLREELTARRQGYPGMLYREIADRILGRLMDPPQEEFMIVAGFNALNSCEEQIFEWLRSHGAEFYWDYDQSYVNAEKKEAGRFLKKHIRTFSAPVELDTFRGLESEKQFRIMELPTNVLQAKMVHRILEDHDPKELREGTDTALVLCDEDLLIPVLTSLPESIGEVNITMGYPLKSTPPAHLTDLLFRLQSNCRKNEGGEWLFYHRYVTDLLLHPLIHPMTGPAIRGLLDEVVCSNLLWISSGMMDEDPARILFRRVDGAIAMQNYLKQVLQEILDHRASEGESSPGELDRAAILQMIMLLHQIESWLVQRPDLPLKTMERFFRRLVSSTRIPFEGEPLTGLQVMGILETRLLDFRHVIMLSMNEDIMPASSPPQSYVPYTLRLAFGMPSREDMDAIYAYYFHRLLQRAERVDLLYNSSSEGIRSGERSRYLYQLIFEKDLQVRRPGFTVEARQAFPVTIPHTERIDELLARFTKPSPDSDHRYLSASAINAYIDCPLRFYFRYLAGIGETMQVEEEIDASGFGTVVHDTISLLYEELAVNSKRWITPEALTGLAGSNRPQELLEKVFLRVHHHGRAEKIEGRNIIALTVMQRFLERVFTTDIAIAPFQLVSTETTYMREMQIDRSGTLLKVRIGGKIDRVDRVDGQLRVIDYKTGNATQSFPFIESLFDPLNAGRNGAALQALLYAWLISDKYPGESVLPGLYVMKYLKREQYDPGFTIGARSDKMPLVRSDSWQAEFPEKLEQTVSRIFNPGIPFDQTGREDRCRSCDYARICERQQND